MEVVVGTEQFDCLEIHASYVFRNEDGKMRETSFSTLCLLHESPKIELVTAHAVVDAIKWARSFEKGLVENEAFGTGLHLGCIKVSSFSIHRMDENGCLRPGRGFGYIFEWKCDWGSELDSYLEHSLEKIREGKVPVGEPHRG